VAEIRLLLESAVLQANAEFAPDDGENDDDERSEEDRSMTAAFRAFGDSGGDEADDEDSGSDGD